MSEILTYDDGFASDAQLVKHVTLASKGGAIMAMFQFPLDGDLAKALTNGQGNICLVKVSFSRHKAKTREDERTIVQGQLGLNTLPGVGETPAEPAGEEEIPEEEGFDEEDSPGEGEGEEGEGFEESETPENDETPAESETPAEETPPSED